jgi:glyoxylate reductase
MKVLVTGKLPDAILEKIKSRHYVESNPETRPMEREAIAASIADKEGLLCMITDQVDENLLKSAPSLKIIANYGVGFNNINVGAASKRGIPVTNTPGVLTDATADLTLALILATGRRLVEGDKHTRAGKFTYWAPLHFLGHDISGKILGIVGLGRIGRAVAKRAAGFGMKTIYFNRHRLDREEEQNLNVVYTGLPDLLKQSDFISLHVPLVPETRHLIAEAQLQQMKPTAFLINTSRGPVIDEAALCRALENRDIAGAGLDVYENEPQLTRGLEKLDNAILLPHMGSATVETRTKMAQIAADNLLAGLRGELPPNCLNPESVSMGK